MLSSACGRRLEMEDASVVCDLTLKFAGERSALLFGVFDGHGGSEAAQFCADHIAQQIEKLAAKQDLSNALLARTVTKLDKRFCVEANSRGYLSGATLNACLVVDGGLWVTNLGDSRAVLCRGKTAVDLSRDHKPSDAPELGRIESAGGRVIVQRVLNLAQLCRVKPELRDQLAFDVPIPHKLAKLAGFSSVARIEGELSVSRSIGDIEFKLPFAAGIHGERVTADLVSNQADATHTQLREEDKFVVVACDGLWDVLTSQQVIDFVHDSIDSFADPFRAVHELVTEALRLGSTDNISAAVLFLPYTKFVLDPLGVSSHQDELDGLEL